MRDGIASWRGAIFLMFWHEHLPDSFVKTRSHTNNWRGCNYCKVAWLDGGEVPEIGRRSHVDRTSNLLIDSAALPLLGEGGVPCSCGKVFVCSCVTPVRRARDPRAHLALTFSISASALLKSSLSAPPRASLLLGWRRSILSSLRQLQSQVQWPIHRITALDWCRESDLWIIIRLPVENAIPEECK